MSYSYFCRESDNRKESFFSEIPPRKPTQDQHKQPCCQSSESNSSDLPDYIISCINYCCFYIRYDVGRAKLARLLLAEGLIPHKDGEIMEDSAEMVIDELINLGLLQVLYHYGFHHQLLRLSDPFTSFERLDEHDFITRAGNSPVRAIVEDDGKNNPPNFNGLVIQSLFLVAIDRRTGSGFRPNYDGLSRNYLRSICKLQNLIVLDLNGKLESLPDDIGELALLRYLSLDCSYLDQLPSALFGLTNLQTLEINLCGKNMYELPAELLNLQQLRHLLMSKCINDGEIRVTKGIGKLVNLQTCDGIYAGDHEGTATELGNLTELRKLAVRRVADDHGNELSAAIMKMTSLISLSLAAENSSSIRTSSLFPEFESFVPPPLLQELSLLGGLIEIPKWIFSIRELTILTLSNSNLLEDSTSVLQFLPKLKHLALYNVSKAKTIGKDFCNADGFLKLESLTICSRYLVEWTEIVYGAFPSLKHICFRNCLKLRFLPEGLQNIHTLQGLSLMPSYNDLGRRLKGEENYKIKHVSDVRIRELY